MLNESQLEAAARNFCKIMRIDADVKVAHGPDPDDSGFIPDVCLKSRQWVLVAHEIKRIEAMMESIAQAKGETE